MPRTDKSWIFVRGSDPATIGRAIIEHSAITVPEKPQSHWVAVTGLGPDRYAITFDPPAPPYEFVNLIGWLNDSRMCPGAKRSVGWLVSPGDGTRYFLTPPDGNPGGDTLIGVSGDGAGISVFLPDCSVTRSGMKAADVVEEPDLNTVEDAAMKFIVTLDGDTSFGNPRFVVR